MINLRAEDDHQQVTISTTGLTPEEVSDLAAGLRVEGVVRRRQLVSDTAWELAEEVKADW